MKRVNENIGRVLRLTLAVTTLLFTQQALAVGTPAGQTISNTASIDYSVGGTPQDRIVGPSADFVVDRLVNFTLVPEDGSSTEVTPGGTDGIASFLLTNIGNDVTDFQLSAVNIAVTVNSIADAFDMNTPIEVFADVNDDGLLDGGDTPFVDDLSADDSAGANQIRILVVAGAPVGPTNGQGASVELDTTAVDDATAATPTALTTDAAADDINAEQIVVATGTLLAQDGFVISSADIEVTKVPAVVSDPFSSSNPKAIPGAVVEYAITATNTGAQDATGIGFIDPLDLSLVALALGEYGAFDAIVEQGGSTVFSCTLDEDDGNGDGCGIFDVATSPEVRILPPALALGGTISGTDNAGTARFRVTIN